MNGPLSGKQKREYLKFAAKEQREDRKAELEESRKQELHEIKLQEAAQKANQSLSHKEDVHAAKMEELGGPLSEKKDSPKVGPTDTVPAMLTPGEAVIPRKAAQDPMNKPIIAQMVAEGRQGYATGTINVRDNLPSIPIVGVKKRGVKGYNLGTTYAGDDTPEFFSEEDKKKDGWVVAPPSVTANRALTIAERNQNPGNLMFIGQEGAVRGEPKAGGGNWAGFQSYEDGRKALENDLIAKTQKQDLTIGQTINKYAPPSENNTVGYASSVASKLGLNVNDKVPVSAIPEMANAVEFKENGKLYGANTQRSGVPVIPQPDKGGLNAPWWSPEYVKAANSSDLNGLELERLRRKEAGKEGISSLDPLQSAIKHGVVGGIPKPSGEPAAVVPPIPYGRNTEDPGTSNRIPLQPEETARINYERDNMAAAQFTQANEDVIAAEAARIRSSNAEPEKQQSMMALFLSNLFGDKGIFNKKDLARFAVMAAGGLVTGGSVNGSLRYAAKDTLANADKRAAQEYASNERKATAQESELRSEKTKFESINSQVSIPSDAKKEIEKMLTFKPNATTAEKTEVYRQANILLGQHAARAAAATSNTMTRHEGFNPRGEQVPYLVDRQGKQYIFNSEGAPVPSPQRLISIEDHSKLKAQTIRDISPRVEKLIRENNKGEKGYTDSAMKSDADTYASYFHNITRDMNIDPSKIGSLVESTLRSVDLKSGNKLSEAALEKAVYGNAIMQLRETVKDKYYSAYNKDGKTTPSAEALVTYGNAVTNLAKEKKVSIDEAAILLEKKWDDYLKGLNSEERKQRSSVKVEGYSPMMQWVRTQK